MRIFLAAPFFSRAERDFNSKATRVLRGEGFEVWLAQEHKFIEGNSIKEKRSIFEEDLDALKKSDLVLAVLDGVDVDSGVAFEMGFAHALKKTILGLKTDHRVFSKLESVNLMIEAPLTRIFKSVDEALGCLQTSKHRKK
nr:nucleoside 2-deoxyribosyltransferase [Candidatus Njordarchaeum guaymaensis]